MYMNKEDLQPCSKLVKISEKVFCIYMCIKSGGLDFYTGQFIVFCHASSALAECCVDPEGFIQVR